MEYHKVHGRRKAGTWGKPHKKNRTDANQGTRTLTHREEIIAVKEMIDDEAENQIEKMMDFDHED